MKNIKSLLISAQVLTAGFGFTQPDEFPSLNDYDLQGPVKSVSTSYSTYDKKPEDRLNMEYTTEFNEAGNVTAWNLTFDALYLELGGTYNYDENGKLIEDMRNDGDKDYVYQAWKYDENNRLIERAEYYSDGTVDATTTYIYNDAGQLIQKDVSYDEDGEPVSHYYTYNQDGELIRMKEDWEYFIETTTYAYDDDGNIIEEAFSVGGTFGDPESSYTIYTTWDSNGKWIARTEVDYKGKILYKEAAEYDEAGNLTNHYVMNKKGKVQSVTIYSTYDEHNNWHESRTYSGKKLTSSESREITYY